MRHSYDSIARKIQPRQGLDGRPDGHRRHINHRLSAIQYAIRPVNRDEHLLGMMKKEMYV